MIALMTAAARKKKGCLSAQWPDSFLASVRRKYPQRVLLVGQGSLNLRQRFQENDAKWEIADEDEAIVNGHE